MNKQELIESLTDTFKVCLETAIKKNADYSSIEDPFKNFRMSTQV